MESATGLSHSPEQVAHLHRLRSTLARVKGELELAEVDGTAPPVQRLLDDLEEAFRHLSAAEDADRPLDEQARVVVIDDDARLAEITAKGLRRLGFEVATSGLIGDVAQGVVIVADLGLVAQLDASGLSNLHRARPIIVTGATDQPSRELAARVDAAAYLVKPVQLEELAAAIRKRQDEESQAT